MRTIAQIAMTELSRALKAAVAFVGVAALVFAIKVGHVLIRLFFGRIGLALLEEQSGGS